MKPFDASGAFRLTKEGHLGKATVRGAGVTIFAAAASFILQMGATVVLARLLTPADFGLVTMVTTFSLLFCSFGLNGFTEGIVQRDEVTHQLVSNVFWINVGGGLLLTGVFAAISPLIGRFYHNSLVPEVAAGTSLTILAGSLSVIHLALLNRGMRFTAVSINNIVARFVSVVVSIGFGLGGWGYWALVAGSIAQQVSLAVGAWTLCQWLPSWPRRCPGTGALLKFAMNVYSRFMFGYFSGNTDNLLVGWRFGASSLGFYKKAFDLFCVLPSQLTTPIGIVVVSALSRVKNDREQYLRYFFTGISVLALVSMGMGADFTLTSYDMVRLLLGPSWTETARIFTFFGPGIGIMLLASTHSWIHLSIGRPDRWFRWGVFEFICTVGLFFLGLRWGPAGIALAWTVSYFVLMLPAFWYAGRPIGLGIGPVVAVIWRYAAAALMGSWLTVLFTHMIPVYSGVPGPFAALIRISYVSLVLAAFYLGAVTILYQGFEPIRQAIRLAGHLRPVPSLPVAAGQDV